MSMNSQQCREIPLTQGQVALVDVEDYEWINQWKWYAWSNGRSFYAVRTESVTKKRFYMHREILGLKHGDARKGDHKNPSLTLDNRRQNLRVADDFESSVNTRVKKSSKSGVKGVSMVPGRNAGEPCRYRASLRFRGKRIVLGYGKSLEEARAIWRAGALKYHGEFARID